MGKTLALAFGIGRHPAKQAYCGEHVAWARLLHRHEVVISVSSCFLFFLLVSQFISWNYEDC